MKSTVRDRLTGEKQPASGLSQPAKHFAYRGRLSGLEERRADGAAPKAAECDDFVAQQGGVS